MNIRNTMLTIFMIGTAFTSPAIADELRNKEIQTGVRATEVITGVWACGGLVTGGLQGFVTGGRLGAMVGGAAGMVVGGTAGLLTELALKSAILHKLDEKKDSPKKDIIKDKE
jgi:outer membrane lipoprotein SlyB